MEEHTPAFRLRQGNGERKVIAKRISQLSVNSSPLPNKVTECQESGSLSDSPLTPTKILGLANKTSSNSPKAVINSSEQNQTE